MIAVDTSTLVMIAFAEPEPELFAGHPERGQRTLTLLSTDTQLPILTVNLVHILSMYTMPLRE